MFHFARARISVLTCIAVIAWAVITALARQQVAATSGELQNRQERFGVRNQQPSGARPAIVNRLLIDGRENDLLDLKEDDGREWMAL